MTKFEGPLSLLERAKLLTEKETAELLNCSRDTVRRLAAAGKLRRVDFSVRRHGYTVGNVLDLINPPSVA
jgi:excisionase family DNA binding protein